MLTTVYREGYERVAGLEAVKVSVFFLCEVVFRPYRSEIETQMGIFYKPLGWWRGQLLSQSSVKLSFLASV